MAEHGKLFFGQTPQYGAHGRDAINVILNSPHHDYALRVLQPAAERKIVNAIESGSSQLILNIERVYRP
jgi:hypothetical protein